MRDAACPTSTGGGGGLKRRVHVTSRAHDVACMSGSTSPLALAPAAHLTLLPPGSARCAAGFGCRVATGRVVPGARAPRQPRAGGAARGAILHRAAAARVGGDPLEPPAGRLGRPARTRGAQGRRRRAQGSRTEAGRSHFAAQSPRRACMLCVPSPRRHSGNAGLARRRRAHRPAEPLPARGRRPPRGGRRCWFLGAIPWRRCWFRVGSSSPPRRRRWGCALPSPHVTPRSPYATPARVPMRQKLYGLGYKCIEVKKRGLGGRRWPKTRASACCRGPLVPRAARRAPSAPPRLTRA